MKIKQLTIIGLGLIGGSLAMAVKKKKIPVKIIGSSGHASTVKKALLRGIIDAGEMDHKKAVKGSDLIFICTPISLIIPTLKEIAPHIKTGAIVTDVGSTKSLIVKAAERIIGKKAYFVGGHPMAGTERTGLDAAYPSLFEGKPYILTPTRKTNRRALKMLKAFIKNLKVSPLELSPQLQDELVAGISHLPLAVSAALVNTIASTPDREKFRSVASSGFRDTTRVASGSPVMGVDLFTTNKAAVLKMIGLFKKSLTKLEGKIRGGDAKAISAYLINAKNFRDRVYPK
jgi:prephenate dehydrogenase